MLKPESSPCSVWLSEQEAALTLRYWRGFRECERLSFGVCLFMLALSLETVLVTMVILNLIGLSFAAYYVLRKK